jgi:hypothetical protein
LNSDTLQSVLLLILIPTTGNKKHFTRLPQDHFDKPPIATALQASV